MIFLVGISTKALLAYHKLYPEEYPNLLLSYAQRTREFSDFFYTHRSIIGSLILDSGTYTLNSNPRKFAKIITLDGYRSYLKHAGSHFKFYFNFDQDYSASGIGNNLFNQQNLEQAGLSPVPVVHNCYSDEIQYYIDNGYGLVSIGSGELESQSIDELRRIVEKLYSKGIRVHFLGCTNYQKLAYVPVYSADSATWSQAAGRGHLLYWNPRKPGIDKMEKICFVYSSPKKYIVIHIDNHPDQTQIDRYLKNELGFSIRDLKGPQGSFRRLIANIHYYVRLEKRIAAKHRELGFRYWI
jgi:hypothetical protein